MSMDLRCFNGQPSADSSFVVEPHPSIYGGKVTRESMRAFRVANGQPESLGSRSVDLGAIGQVAGMDAAPQIIIPETPPAPEIG
ncbi:MAG: hypothetical protein JWO47_559 [Candidatus Saccharibacteria bacterium]|nr:hypothetical protein [Candidatus Saccharibacteria bacterium]